MADWSALFLLAGARRSLRLLLPPPKSLTSSPRLPTVSGALISIVIFGIAVGVRTLHWQDSHVQILHSTTSLSGVFDRYRKEARRMLEQRALLFPEDKPAPGDARMLAHPPGYSILLAAINRVSSNLNRVSWIIQILSDAAAAMLVFLIGSGLLGRVVGLIGGMLVALSPQLAYYSLLFTPDSLAVLPLLASIYFFVLAMKRPRLIYLVCSGAFVGMSCWLAASAMLLAPFLSLLALVLFETGRRLRYSIALVGAAVVMIAPITVRNLVLFHRLIPISIQAGLSVAEGIGDFDQQRELGMPRSDREALVKDVEWSGRDDYGRSLWFPDGIERDQTRLSRGLAAIRTRPIWFLGIMLRRAAFMMRYNDSAVYGWPLDSSVVGYIQAEPPFSHDSLFDSGEHPSGPADCILVLGGQVLDHAAVLPQNTVVSWSGSPSDFKASGRLTEAARADLTQGSGMLNITGDTSAYGDQFVSAPIPVQPHTDYLLLIQLAAPGGPMAVKVLSRDMKIALGWSAVSSSITAAEISPKRTSALDDVGREQAPAAPRQVQFQIPFATGQRSELCIVFSNNGRAPEPPSIGIGDASLIMMGPTGSKLARFPRLAIRTLQKTLFTTSHTVTLILAGVALLAVAGRFRTLCALLAVPVYYMGVQSALHTEYRYILGIHYFAFILAAVAIHCAALLGYRAVTSIPRALARRPRTLRMRSGAEGSSDL